VAQAERNLSETTLTAPFGGIIRSESIEVGRQVSTNDVIASLYDNHALEAKITVSDQQYGRLISDTAPIIGRKSEISWNVGGTPITYQGVIDRVGADIDASRGGVNLLIRFDASDQAGGIRPGAFVTVSVPDRTYPSSVRLPEEAVYNGQHVFVVEDGRLVQTTIELLAFDGSQVIVGGLSDGAKILASRFAEAGNGIKVSEEGAAPPARSGNAQGGERTGKAGKNGKDASTTKGAETGGQRRQGGQRRRPNAARGGGG
jgi:RND family efflux transporter MFP subunit